MSTLKTPLALQGVLIYRITETKGNWNWVNESKNWVSVVLFGCVVHVPREAAPRSCPWNSFNIILVLLDSFCSVKRKQG